MCKSCSMNGYGRKKSKKTMKRRRISGISKKGISKLVTEDLLPVTAGYVAGKYIPGLILKNQPQYENYLALAAGALLGATQKGMVAKLGLGMAVKGAAGVVGDLMDGSVNGLGLLPPGVPSVRISGYGDPVLDEPIESVKVQ